MWVLHAQAGRERQRMRSGEEGGGGVRIEIPGTRWAWEITRHDITGWMDKIVPGEAGEARDSLVWVSTTIQKMHG